MSTKIKLAYFGTPDFSADLLSTILTKGTKIFEVILVVTQPDKPVGRKKQLTPSPVKTYALSRNIPVFEAMNEELISHLSTCDIALVFAYGEMINAGLLRAPRYGVWNIHPSALPKYRGASPVAFPLILGDKATSVSLIQMDEKMDHGPILSQEEIAIEPQVLNAELLSKLAQMSYYMLENCVKNISTISSIWTVQDDSIATFTQLLSRQSGYIPLPSLLKMNADDILESEELPDVIKTFLQKNPTYQFSIPSGQQLLWNLYRGLSPWPGLWTEIVLSGMPKRLKIAGMTYNEGSPRISQVQLEGKTPVSIEIFNQTYRIF